MRNYAWWVGYTFEYEYFDNETGELESYYDSDSGRFNCTKKEIKKKVKEHIETYELQGQQYRNLIITINDQYMTTLTEV